MKGATFATSRNYLITREGTLLIAEKHWENLHHAVGQVWFLDPQEAVPTQHIEVYPSDPQISDTPVSNIAVNPRTGEFAVSGWISRQTLKSYSFRIFSKEGNCSPHPLNLVTMRRVNNRVSVIPPMENFCSSATETKREPSESSMQIDIPF